MVASQLPDTLYIFNTKIGLHNVLTSFGQLIANIMGNEIFNNIVPVEMVEFKMNVDEEKVIILLEYLNLFRLLRLFIKRRYMWSPKKDCHSSWSYKIPS